MLKKEIRGKENNLSSDNCLVCITLKRRYSSRTFRYGYLVTT